MSSGARPVLLYDGLCGFCDGTVRLLLKHDRQETFRFAPLGGAFASRVVARHPHLAGIDSLILVEGSAADSTDRVFVRSEALLRATGHLGGVWRLVDVLRMVPRPLRDWGYDVFARHRYRMWGRFERCPVPPAGVRERFLD